MNKETGGPAFPIDRIAINKEFGSSGMTLRDYFAAQAMQALLIATKTADGNMIIKDAYNIADAMLKARES
jgi:hypothetical protein